MKLELGILKGRSSRAGLVRPTGRKACEYHKSNGTLKVSCRGCTHAQSLESPACFKGVLRILANETGVREVLLSRDWEIVYNRDCVAIMNSVAEVSKFCTSLTHHLPFEDCQGCLSNPRAIFSRLVERLPQCSPEAEYVSSLRSGGHGTACEQCVRSTRSNLEHVASLVSEAERKVARTAFRVVSVDDHA